MCYSGLLLKSQGIKQRQSTKLKYSVGESLLIKASELILGFLDFSMDGFTLPLHPYGRGDSHENEKQEKQTQGRLNMQYYYVK